MKTKLQTLLTALSFLFLMAKAFAQQPAPINPVTGLPETVANIDPATGLPADGSPPFKDARGEPTWISPDWKEPAEDMGPKVLDSVSFQGLPLSEVARYLRQRFDNSFDIILPNSADGFDPTQINVELELKNVTATEIFRAMNLQFELDKSPLRWELTFNGQRPTAIPRYLPQLVPAAPPPPPETRKVFYVGDMIDDYPGADDASKLEDITGIIRATGGSALSVKKYPPAQLLIVSGPPDQVDLAEQTLRALKEKAGNDKVRPRSTPVNSQ